MKIQEMKNQVYQLSGKLSKQLKKLHQGIDLRYRAAWEWLIKHYNNKLPQLNMFQPRGVVRQATIPTVMTTSGTSQFPDLTKEEYEARMQVWRALPATQRRFG